MLRTCFSCFWHHLKHLSGRKSTVRSVSSRVWSAKCTDQINFIIMCKSRILFSPPFLLLPLWSRNIYLVSIFKFAPFYHHLVQCDLPPSYLFKATRGAQNPTPQLAPFKPVGLWRNEVLVTSNVVDQTAAFKLCLFTLQTHGASSS